MLNVFYISFDLDVSEMEETLIGSLDYGIVVCQDPGHYFTDIFTCIIKLLDINVDFTYRLSGCFLKGQKVLKLSMFYFV